MIIGFSIGAVILAIVVLVVFNIGNKGVPVLGEIDTCERCCVWQEGQAYVGKLDIYDRCWCSPELALPDEQLKGPYECDLDGYELSQPADVVVDIPADSLEQSIQITPAGPGE